MKTHQIPRSKDYERNIDRLGEHSNTCVCCGRRTAEKHFIHAHIGWEAVDTENEDLSEIESESQGFFPIGPECAKKLPKEFIFNNI